MLTPLSDPYSLQFERRNYVNGLFQKMHGRVPQPVILRHTGSNQGLEDSYQRTLVMPSRFNYYRSEDLPQALYTGSNGMIPSRYDALNEYNAVQALARPTVTRFASPGPNQLDMQ
jgi:hypothetical protein